MATKPEPIDMSEPDFCEDLLEELWDAKSKKARYQAVLLHFSDNRKEIDQAMQEWVLVGTPETESEPDRDPQRHQDLHCICSHAITKPYYIENIYTRCVLRVGSECVAKTGGSGLVSQDLKCLKRQRQYQEHGTGTKRLCQGCQLHKVPITQPDWMVLCKACFAAKRPATPAVILGGRQCADCRRLCIASTAPVWIKLCQPCWKKTQKPPNPEAAPAYRLCIGCGALRIASTEPGWIKKCLPCFKASKAASRGMSRR